MNQPPIFKFCLYIAGDTPNSSQALLNLKAICAEYLAGRHQIEIVDVFHDPKRGLADGIILTPSLIKITPLPCRKIIGILNQKDSVLLALGLDTLAA